MLSSWVECALRCFITGLKNKLDRARLEALRKTGAGVVVRYKNKKVENRMHGGKRLKSTQAYTPMFGRKVARLRLQSLPTVLAEPARRVIYRNEPVHSDWNTDPWDDAHIQRVFEYVQRHASRANAVGAGRL